jgi:hypothetical protein
MVRNSSLHCSKIREQVKWPRNLNAALFSHNGILLTEQIFQETKITLTYNTRLFKLHKHILLFEKVVIHWHTSTTYSNTNRNEQYERRYYSRQYLKITTKTLQCPLKY